MEPKINYRKLFESAKYMKWRDDLNLGCFHVSAVEELILQNGSEHSKIISAIYATCVASEVDILLSPGGGG